MSVVHDELAQALADAGWLSGPWHHLRSPARRGTPSAPGRSGVSAAVVNFMRRTGLMRRADEAADHASRGHEGFGFGTHHGAPWIDVRPMPGGGFVAVFRSSTAGTPRRMKFAEADEVVAQLNEWRQAMTPEQQALFGAPPTPPPPAKKAKR